MDKKIFKIDEYYTSKKCHHCEKYLNYANFMDFTTGKIIYNQRLMRCINKNYPYDTINRDKNAACNVARVGYDMWLVFSIIKTEYLKKLMWDRLLFNFLKTHLRHRNMALGVFLKNLKKVDPTSAF
jgi:hypothetical protein